MANIYTSYYINQIGTGQIGETYASDFNGVQRGRGLGSILGGLVRFLKPLFMKGVRTLTGQAIKTGTQILGDIGTKPLKDIIIERGKQARDELAEKAFNKIRKMTGQGINTLKRGKKFIPLISSRTHGSSLSTCKKDNLHKVKKSISKTKRQSRESVKNKKERHLDIFS